MAHPPIAVMSFNRPDYLRQVLESLAAQADIAQREVFLFQDHWRNEHSGRVLGTAEEVEACIAAFRDIFPRGHVLAAPANLGVAENFHRAETLFFRELKADCGYFFEDDLVLAPRYLATLDALRDATGPTGKVGYFACYGHLQADLAEQARRARLLRRIGHLWGFGLFRSHWEEMQPLMAEYYELVLGRDYKTRPHEEIQRRYRGRGILIGVTSQDDVKKAVTYALGRVGLNTHVASGRYIGAVGLHMNPKKFEASGFARTEWLDLPRVEFDLPDAAGFAALHAEEMQVRARNIEKEAEKAREKEAARAALRAPAAPAAAPVPVTVPALDVPASAPIAAPVAAP
ncbi:glycosyltransferase family 2 protein, partial [Falsiroseomonas oryzae]|uniref:glycosyltransferase family 2 protein n=1 Tax=Falsiroseomonas oryzae TaxID=2766473 RepID=UPI0022EA153D